MVNTSEEYKRAILNNRIFAYDIRITPVGSEAIQIPQKLIKSLSVDDAVSGENSFDIGAAIIGQCTIKFDNTDEMYSDIEFNEAEVIVKVGLELGNTTEWIQKGIFNAEPGDENGSVITIKSYDNMIKFDRPYSESKLEYPATIGQIVMDACIICGVSLATTAFSGDDYVVQSRPDDEALTFRDILQYAGQIVCKWFRCNPYGYLEVGFYDLSSYEQDEKEKFHDIKTMWALTKSTDDVIITGVKVAEDDEENSSASQFGEDGYVISIEKNPLIQGQNGSTIAAMLGEKLVGLRFRKLSVQHQSDPSIEAGDIAMVTDRKGNVYKTLITETTFQIGGAQKTSCNAKSPARNSSQRFSEVTKAYVAARKYAQKILGRYETQVDAMTQLISQGFGMNMGKITLPSGEVVDAMYNGPTPEESSYVCYWTSNGILASVDGGTTWAVDRNGNALFNTIAARGITADWIDSGRIAVKDKSGNIIFLVDMDTGQVLIEGSYVRIGEKTLDQALNDNVDLSMQLNNDYANIPVDSEGKYTFIDVTVTPAVYYGTQNITADCNFTLNESQYIAGNWDDAAKAYTVTDLTADIAWVDITAVYLGTFSITKRFTIAKLYSGADAKIYSIDASSDIVKTSKNGYDNSCIELAAYSQVEGENPSAYSGRFRINEIRDYGFGGEEETVYESAADESSVTHMLYTALIDENGDALVDSSGSALGTIQDGDMLEIHVELYAAGGFEVLLAKKRISFLKDASSLTQSEIFDILTNGGEDQGVYLVNGKLYLNFQYAVGQTLKLGGVGNANGLLEIYDAEGNKIGYIDSTGVNFERGTFSGTLQGGSIEGAKISGSEMRSGVFYSTLSSSSRAVILQKGTMVIGVQDGTDNIVKIDVTQATDMAGSGSAEHYASITGKTGVMLKAKGSGKVPFYVTGSVGAFAVPLQCSSGLTVLGSKSRAVSTEHHGERLLYCYETATPYFGDIGRGRIDENGIAYISIDDIFGETVNTEIEYDVMLTKYGQGDLWVDMELSDSMFFVVRGTPNLAFAWELKAIQKEYEYYRMDETEGIVQEFYPDDTELQALMDEELAQYDEEKEEFFNGEDTESISGD